jgi:hypothetical protein
MARGIYNASSDPVGIYQVGTDVTFVADVGLEYQKRPIRYGLQEGGNTALDVMYIEPEKLATRGQSGIRSLDDISRIVVIAYYEAGASDGAGVLQFGRGLEGAGDPLDIQFELGAQIPFIAGDWDQAHDGEGPIVSVIDNPFPTDFQRQTTGADSIDDALWCRAVITNDFSGGPVPSAITALFVPGSTATQAVPHRGALVSERRFW